MPWARLCVRRSRCGKIKLKLTRMGCGSLVCAWAGVGGTLPPAFQTSLKALEDQILPQDRGGAKGKRRHGEGESEGARWPFYLSAAVGSLFAFA